MIFPGLVIGWEGDVGWHVYMDGRSTRAMIKPSAAKIATGMRIAV